MKKNVYAVLLAGGKGTRLWPLSTEKYSKSFVRIGKRRPLIEESIDRVAGLLGKKNILIVVDDSQKHLLKKAAYSIPKKNILVEPFGRSTASAVGLAAIELDPEDVMVVLPTDAVIENASLFRKTIKKAIAFAQKKDDALICIGVKPRNPSTAYGYIKVKRQVAGLAYSVDKFIEKPNEKKAKMFLRKQIYLWNAGMFVFKAKTLLDAMKKHAPSLHKELERIKKDKKKTESAYSRMKNVSIDYQIMEKVKNLYCVKGDFAWNDLGSWVSVATLFKKDKEGNVSFGNVRLMNAKGCIVYNTEEATLGVVGLKNAIVVHTKNGTLVCDKEKAEKVKKIKEV